MNISDNLNFQENKMNNLQSEFRQMNHIGKENEELFLKKSLKILKINLMDIIMINIGKKLLKI